MATIKQIKVGSTNYDLDALHLLDNGGTGHSYEDIVALINKGLQIVIDDKASGKDEPATPASAATMGKLYLVQLSGQELSGTYTEFITLEIGTSTKTYSWEKIGTTAADLSQYAKKTEAAKPGTYTSTAPSTDATSSAGDQTATGTATVTYKKSAEVTGSAGAISGNTGDGGAVNITYTPEGSISGTQTISAHSHTVNASSETVSISTTAATKKGVKVTTEAADTASVGISGGSITGATPVTVVTGVTANIAIPTWYEKTISVTSTSATSLSFTGLTGEPKAFMAYFVTSGSGSSSIVSGGTAYNVVSMSNMYNWTAPLTTLLFFVNAPCLTKGMLSMLGSDSQLSGFSNVYSSGTLTFTFSGGSSYRFCGGTGGSWVLRYLV